MNTLQKYLAGALLATVMVAVPSASAQEHDRHRYYDRDHKDYHRWDENEQRSYGVFLNENHIAIHVFRKAPRDEQQRYWNWRHDHPDERR